MTSNRRYFSFNKIYVIESLFTNDRKTGEELFNDIIRYMPYKLPFLEVEFRRINGKSEFELFFKELQQVVSTGSHPYLHFEIHGSVEGFVLNSNEIIEWDEVATLLRSINIITQNNTMVSLATCFGANIYGSIYPTEPAPFFGFIGPWEKVYENEVLVSFIQYFQFIMESKDFQDIDLKTAVKILNEGNTEAKFVLAVSEAIFNRALLEYTNLLKDPAQRNRRVSSLFKLAAKDKNIKRAFSNKELKREIERGYIITEPQVIQLKKQFLMSD